VTVNLTRIYTKLGDGGETHLGDMSRVPKTHPRIEAYGTVDELNALIGLALTVEGLPERYADGCAGPRTTCSTSAPTSRCPRATARRRERLRVRPEQVEWLEAACDEVNADLPKLQSFLLPGGTAAAAHLHVCRTVCRARERRSTGRRGGQPRGRPLPQPALRPPLYPRARRQRRRRRAPVGARRIADELELDQPTATGAARTGRRP
jgi:cob(I)alamin adenosyltransferase